MKHLGKECLHYVKKLEYERREAEGMPLKPGPPSGPPSPYSACESRQVLLPSTYQPHRPKYIVIPSASRVHRGQFYSLLSIPLA